MVTSLGLAGIELDVVPGKLDIDEGAARRWCWIEPWTLIEQDEDLFLMDEKFFIPFLDEAGAGCPKRDYAISIIEHAIRDGAHAALRDPDTLPGHLAAAAKWIPHAQRAKAMKLADYCRRLAKYSEIARVDAEGAIDRGRDLTRCAPTPQPLVERRDDVWFVDISSREPRQEALVIEVGSGKMWTEKWPKAGP